MKNVELRMMSAVKPNPVRDQSYAFALDIVRFCSNLQRNREFVLSKQLLKAGTSIGANIEEAINGQSKPDFIAKLSISLKEAHESDYWLRLIGDSGYVEMSHITVLRSKLDEIISLLTAIIRRSRYNLEWERQNR